MEEHTQTRLILFIGLLGVCGYAHLYHMMIMSQCQCQSDIKVLKELFLLDKDINPNNFINRERSGFPDKYFTNDEEEISSTRYDLDRFFGKQIDDDDVLDTNYKRSKRSISSQPNVTIKASNVRAKSLNENSTDTEIILVLQKLQKEVKRMKQPSKVQNKAIHLAAHVNRDRLSRQDIADRKGQYVGGSGSFHLKEKIFNIWREESWYDRKMFNFNSSSGIVTVKKTGMYIVYVKVLLHSDSLRKTLGVYVNHKFTPIMEYVSLDQTRRRRHLLGEDENQGGVARKSHNARWKRHRTIYNRADLFGVVRLSAGDLVYIKSNDQTRGIIVKHYLSYWGIAQINGQEKTKKDKRRRTL